MQTFARAQKENQNAAGQHPIVCYPLCAHTLTSATLTATPCNGLFGKAVRYKLLVARLQARCSDGTSGL